MSSWMFSFSFQVVVTTEIPLAIALSALINRV
jgi:hypothetical protein